MADHDWKERYKEQRAKRNKQQGFEDDGLSLMLDDESAVSDVPSTSSRRAQGQSAGSMTRLRRVIVNAWLVITGLQIVLWLIIGLVTGQLPEPWWLWTAASGGIVALVVWYIAVKMDRDHRKREK